MNETTKRKFYVTLLNEGGEAVGHAISLDPPSSTATSTPPVATQSKIAPEDAGSGKLDFETVCHDFVSSMESYRKFISLTLGIASLLPARIAEQKIGEFVKSRGSARADLSSAKESVYELNIDCYREFSSNNHEVQTAVEGARSLPKVMIIGLVSAYDAFLSQLLRVVLSMHQEIVLTSEKSIKFSELSEFSSIEQARTSLIDREIESVLRESHQEQFSWMERRLAIELRKNLPVWPNFIELCERRNLLTHTGGVVTDQYIANCKAQGLDLSNVAVGTKLTVDSKYYSAAVSIIYEIGVKLCHVMWRKFAKEQREKADNELQSLGYNLIFERAYPIAETLLRFGVSTIKVHANDKIRRMMLVNLANAVRLQKRADEAMKLLQSEDWSVANDEFKICVAAVGGDKKQVLELMKKIGRDGLPTAEDYRSWPVFRGMRTDDDFIESFETTFGEPLIPSTRVEIPSLPEASAAEVVDDEDGAAIRDEVVEKSEIETKH